LHALFSGCETVIGCAGCAAGREILIKVARATLQGMGIACVYRDAASPMRRGSPRLDNPHPRRGRAALDGRPRAGAITRSPVRRH
jgi:hypothetical protein